MILLNSLKKIDINSIVKAKIQLLDDRLIFDNQVIDLSEFEEILLIGFGKASISMGFAVESLLADRITRGILVTNRRSHQSLKSEVIVAGHPTPNANSLTAASKILSALEASTTKTLVIFLVSGGGSSLVELPLLGISLEALQQLNRILVGCGATIQEINLIRKRLSQIKGGKLGSSAKGLQALALYLSDVNQGDLHSLASGPLFAEDTSPEELNRVIDKYNLLEKIPPAIAAILKSELSVEPSTPQSQSQPNIAHSLLLENADLLKIAAGRAESRGFKVEICGDLIEGRYQEIADELLHRLTSLQARFPTEAVCLLSGGEVSCPVSGDGIGGRNQEFVLYSATRFSQVNNSSEVVVLSCGTDGIDGVSCAAGALISNIDFYNSRHTDASFYIEQNDSHSFLKQSGGLLVVSPTGNNVRDLRILLARPKQ